MPMKKQKKSKKLHQKAKVKTGQLGGEGKREVIQKVETFAQGKGKKRKAKSEIKVGDQRPKRRTAGKKQLRPRMVSVADRAKETAKRKKVGPPLRLSKREERKNAQHVVQKDP